MRDNYKPSNDTYTVLMILATCVAVILLFLCSCKTTHEVERVYTHDTLYVNHSDTVKEVKLLAVHDTTTQKEIHYITLNDNGDTIKEIHHYHNSERTIVVDSTDRYKAKNDSLQRLLDRERNKEKVVEKKDWWQSMRYRLILLSLFLSLIAACISYIHLRK